MSRKKDSSVKKNRPGSKHSSVKKDRPDSSPLYFYDDIPCIATCRSCTVLIPEPTIYFTEKQFFKKKRSAQKLYSFGYCTISLLEYDSVEDVVNLTASENQTPTITLNLNRIIDNSLKHIVKDSKVWQEFHLNDSGKKRSFVLQFEKGQEFDEFFKKFREVLSWLHACKKGKLSVDKKYYLVGFRDDPKEVNTKIKRISDSENRESYYSDSSENSTNDEIDSSFVLTPPFSPKPFTIPPTSRVTGSDEELTAGVHKRPESEENKMNRYHLQIFGSMYVPPSADSILKTSNTEQSSINRRKNLSGDVDLDKNGTVKRRDVCRSVNITEIDSYCDHRKTVDIAQLDFDNNKLEGEAGNQQDVLIGDEVTYTTMKARQEQNQLKQYAQLLQAAINDGDQENTRQYADILAVSHLKIAITVDENSLKVEANSQDIKDCLKGAKVHNEEAFLQCPYNDESYSCYASLQDREIKALVPDEIYERYLQKSLSTAESQEMNSFHCKTPDCQGWCNYEDHVNFFKCPVCNKENCLTCKAIHEGVNCKKYQDDLQAQANDNAAARRTRQMLNDMVKKGEAMHCPQCKVILQKMDGCDWLKCSICKTEICWVTKGPRWGPNGPGDISGGCRCRVNGEACHPGCNNCH